MVVVSYSVTVDMPVLEMVDTQGLAVSAKQVVGVVVGTR